ncbi:MAG: RadC family protein [Dehalococcoidia bacterium]
MTAETYRLRIREMPEGERPRERLRDYGAEALSNAELIAILLRTGTAGENVLALATRLLSQHGGLNGLARLGFAELNAMHGLGEAKAAQLMAALQLGMRLTASHPEARVVVRSPADVAGLLMTEMSLLAQEDLRVVLLNTKNQVIKIEHVYRGSVNSAQVRPAEVFREAVRQNCPQLIAVHNHPSGDPTPSKDDIAVTADLVQAGRYLEIDFLDHIVIGQGRFVSLKERNLGFS